MIRLAFFLCAAAVLRAQPGLMPWPAKIDMGQGSLAISTPLRVAIRGYSESRLERAVARLGGVISDESHATLIIECEHAGDDESYHLVVSSKGARLLAPGPLGILYGLQTFRQLIVSAQIPVVDIDDHPRFPWRGLLLDVSRHWMPIEVVKRTLDGMAAVKLNVFHWHLSDDQGFRVESKLFPKLQQLGSDGDFYTQDQIREVIAYARDRGIRVVPEFDVPGHTTSWLVGYPELASAPGPYQIERNWGVFDPTMDPTSESTYQFLDAFIGEMAALFPDPFFHIGGDEVTGKQWTSNVHIRAFMRENHLQTTEDLQAYFSRRLQKIVARHGKRMEGWDEILDADLPKSIVIQSWRGQKWVADAAGHGFSTILSAGYYLDHVELASALYRVDPLGPDAAGLTSEEKARVLGGEVAAWTEFVGPENLDSRIWPRAAAVAERLWSPADVTDVPSMYRRLDAVSDELDHLGLTQKSSYLPMLERLAGGGPIEPLKTLADVVIPLTFGQRIRTHRYNQQTPLTGLPDAVRPESETARQFAELVDRMDRPQIRMWLMRWSDNRTSFQAASEALRRSSTVGLQALNYLDRRQRPPASWLNQQRAYLETLKKPVDDVRIAIVPSIKELVNAAGAQQ
ncbi:MAG TPA: family 20 glycosylhydrolase [Bryobacteraceae bacterium]|nr:family 20 glycosylhydrolase [Bryobacteraceae bacterium]